MIDMITIQDAGLAPMACDVMRVRLHLRTVAASVCSRWLLTLLRS